MNKTSQTGKQQLVKERIPPKINLANQWALFISNQGVTHRSMGKELSTGTEMTLRGITKAPLQHGQQSTKAGKPGAHCTACKQINRLDSVLSGWVQSV